MGNGDYLYERRSTARLAKLAVALLLCVAFGLTGFLMFLQFQAARESAEIQAHRTAHVVATQFAWMLQTSAQALQRIEDAVAQSGRHLPDTHDIHDAVRDLPPGLQHSLYDDSGQLILSSVVEPRLINVSDRDYFHRVRDGEKLVIAPMITERLTGEKVFIVAKRIEVSGLFAGAATIAIPVSTLRDMAEALELEPSSTISLVARDGMVIARFPPIKPINLSGTSSFGQLTTHPNGVYVSPASPADGISRIVGYWSVDAWPLIAVAGINAGSAFSAIRSRVETELIFLLPLMAGILALVLRVFRLQAIDEKREKALVRAHEHTEFLIKEIHHRVKNNLQVVMSLIRLEKLPDSVKTALIGRISAMVTVHQEMYGSETYETIPAAPYLMRLIRNLGNVYGTKVAVEADIAEVDLAGDRAMHLGMLVNELLSNAYKHAFKGRDQGRIDLRLEELDAGQLRLTVRDDGPGVNASDHRENMGSRLISAFVMQMGGQLVTDSENGLRVVVDFPRDADPNPNPQPGF